MSAASDFDAILTQMRARILELTASQNPDVQVAGRTINKSQYLATLLAQYAETLKLQQQADGPFEVRSWGE